MLSAVSNIRNVGKSIESECALKSGELDNAPVQRTPCSPRNIYKMLKIKQHKKQFKQKKKVHK